MHWSNDLRTRKGSGMKRLRMFVFVSAVLAVLIAVQGSQIAQAHGAAQASTCVPAAWQGSYAFVASPLVRVSSGSVIAIPERLLESSPVPYAAKGTLTIDGAGRMVLHVAAEEQGEVATPTVLSGVYATGRGCTLMATFANETRLVVKIVKAGMVRFPVSQTPGFVILRTAETFGR